MIIHVVQKGETLTSVAIKYGISEERLQLDNELPNPEQLIEGQCIVIQYTAITHTVKEGDTLDSIAKQYSVPFLQLLQNNPYLILDRTLYNGQTVVIEYSGEKLGQMDVNGYVYPYVKRDTLLRTLPFLTYLCIFTYGFTSDGTLIPSKDTDIIRICRDYGTAPIMVFSAMDENGQFSDRLAHELLTDLELQKKVIANLLATLKEKNYSGIDLDIEFIFPDDKDAYVAFVKALHAALSPEGFKVSVALAPKISSSQTGSLYGGHDYAGLGAAADKVLLMTYEWGYTYGHFLP